MDKIIENLKRVFVPYPLDVIAETVDRFVVTIYNDVIRLIINSVNLEGGITVCHVYRYNSSRRGTGDEDEVFNHTPEYNTYFVVAVNDKHEFVYFQIQEMEMTTCNAQHAGAISNLSKDCTYVDYSEDRSTVNVCSVGDVFTVFCNAHIFNPKAWFTRSKLGTIHRNLDENFKVVYGNLSADFPDVAVLDLYNSTKPIRTSNGVSHLFSIVPDTRFTSGLAHFEDYNDSVTFEHYYPLLVNSGELLIDDAITLHCTNGEVDVYPSNMYDLQMGRVLADKNYRYDSHIDVPVFSNQDKVGAYNTLDSAINNLTEIQM